MRFFRTDDARAHGAKVLSRTEVGPDEARALFMARLWACFGPARPIDDGFEYVLGDRETGIAFTAYSGASGPSYGASISRDELLPVVRALEALLAATEPAECSIETSLDIDYGGGSVRIGVDAGKPFEKAKKDRRRSARSAKTYDDCLAIAKERGGRYGSEEGWRQCFEQVLPELPDELELDGRVYENCVGLGFSKEKGPFYLFDEGPGLEEIEIARIPWPKPLPAVAELWLSSWERARGR